MCWKISFETQVSACSSFPSEAMLWIKEVDLIDSVDDFKSSRSIQIYTHFLNFVMLDATIASSLNRIIQNSYFKKKVSLEDFRVTGAHDTVLDYANLFSVTLRDDNIQEFDTRWDEVLLSMSKIPSDDIWESLYKLRARESAQLKTVLALYNMETHQKDIDARVIKN